jgi:hypothetical protein
MFDSRSRSRYTKIGAKWSSLSACDEAAGLGAWPLCDSDVITSSYDESDEMHLHLWKLWAF